MKIEFTFRKSKVERGAYVSNRYTHIKITGGERYFLDAINPGGDNLYTAYQICRMVEFLIDNIFVKFGICLFRQVIGIPVGTNCAPPPSASQPPSLFL